MEISAPCPAPVLLKVLLISALVYVGFLVVGDFKYRDKVCHFKISNFRCCSQSIILCWSPSPVFGCCVCRKRESRTQSISELLVPCRGNIDEDSQGKGS